jgi:flavin reductase (NADH)/flavin reductase
MRRLAASVCLITTVNADGSRNGLTATAVCSLSAAPATLLCCLNRSSNSFAAIEAAKVFVVNVLSFEDREIADHFAANPAGGDKFQRGDWRTLVSGAPALQSAIAHFDCRVQSIVPAGTHGIVLGEVMAVTVNAEHTRPLLFVDGGYGGFSPHDIVSGAL